MVGLSILSGAHIRLVGEVRRLMDQQGCGDIPIVVGGIIPAEDMAALKAAGVARVYTPKDFEITAHHPRHRRRRGGGSAPGSVTGRTDSQFRTGFLRNQRPYL